MKKKIKHSVRLNDSSGFTLVELSIVIVIIGLIVAGVVSGQSIVKQARIKSQITDLEKYKTAYYTFILEYNAIPGDFAEANALWGVPDGDGNGFISQDGDHAYQPARENMKFFQHLSEAELLPQRYTGVWQLGVGYPKLKLSPDKGMVVGNAVNDTPGHGPTQQLSPEEEAKIYKAALFLNVANPTGVNSDYNDGPGTANAKTYLNIDTKIDDGIARQGIFKAHRPIGNIHGNCLDAQDGDYFLTNNLPACHGMYIIEK